MTPLPHVSTKRCFEPGARSHPLPSSASLSSASGRSATQFPSATAGNGRDLEVGMCPERMPARGSGTSPVKRPAFKQPPKELGEHRGLHQRLEAVASGTTLTLKAAPREHKAKKVDPNGKEATSEYKKRLFMKHTLGWW